MQKGDRIKLHRKDGTETIIVEIISPYFGLTGFALAQDNTTLQIFTREKKYLWKGFKDEWWIEVTEDETIGYKI